jgi:hypothetical protein
MRAQYACACASHALCTAARSCGSTSNVASDDEPSVVVIAESLVPASDDPPAPFDELLEQATREKAMAKVAYRPLMRGTMAPRYPTR